MIVQVNVNGLIIYVTRNSMTFFFNCVFVENWYLHPIQKSRFKLSIQQMTN
jgi:hypothetical protein